jgi:hypothetical protein
MKTSMQRGTPLALTAQPFRSIRRSDPTAGGGFVNAMRDLRQRTTKGGMSYVFTLP